MRKFTHGIMVLNVKRTTENGDYPVVHFVGYWEEPTKEDIEHIKNELKNNEPVWM